MYNRFGVWQSASSQESDPEESRPKGNLKTVFFPGQVRDAITYLSLPLEMIPTDIPLACSLYVRISEKFVLFRKQGDTLTQARSAALHGPSSGVIYVSLDEWNRLLHSLEAVLIAGQNSQETLSGLAKGLQIRNLLMAYAREMERKKQIDLPALERIRPLAEMLATVLYQNAALSQSLLKRYQDPTLYHINHAVNVAIYSIVVAKKQNVPLASAQALSFAALVHNVGNTLVPANLLYKPGELTVEEKNTVDTHILHGGTLLQSLQAPKDIVLTAMQHHDRYDGQGLAPGKGGEEIHLFARICSIADVYDAITSHRPYHMNPLNAQDAIKRMLDMRGKFDPKILPMVVEDED